MDAERWQRIQDLFAEALKRPREARGAFLEEHCGGDRELSQEVESLVESTSATDSFLEETVRGGYEIFDAEPPRRQIGKYEIRRKIGQGGFGTVYQGFDPLLQRHVAVKTCTTDNTDLRRRFFREGQIAAKLQHPNVTTIHDFGLEDNVPYLVQEFLTGQDLHDVVEKTALSTTAKVDVLTQVARGLAYAHGEGVLHRDVKPANLRVLESGTVKIMDFGIARLLTGADTRLTGTGMTIGTVGYLAPEQLKGGEIDARADMFAFGVLAYELFAGIRPFVGETFSQVSYQLLYEEPVALEKKWSECPDERLLQVVNRCLRKDVGQRYKSMDEVVSELEAVLARLRAEPSPDPTLEMPRSVLPGSQAGPPTLLDVPSSQELTQLEVLAAPESTLVETSVRLPLWKRPAVRAVLVVIVAAVAIWRLTAGSGGGGLEMLPAPVSPQTEESDLPPPVPEGPEITAAAPVEPSVEEPASATEESEDPPVAVEQALDPRPPSVIPPPRSEPTPVAGTPPTAPAMPREVSAPVEVSTPASEPAGPEPVIPTAAASPQTPAAPEPSPPPDRVAAAPQMKRGDFIDPADPGVVPPEIVEAVAPVYPRKARRRRISAKVVIGVLVDENGDVERAMIVKSDDSGLGFNLAAKGAAQRTRFRPATRDGIPGKMWTEIPYDFSLDR